MFVHVWMLISVGPEQREHADVFNVRGYYFHLTLSSHMVFNNFRNKGRNYPYLFNAVCLY